MVLFLGEDGGGWTMIQLTTLKATLINKEELPTKMQKNMIVMVNGINSWIFRGQGLYCDGIKKGNWKYFN